MFSSKCNRLKITVTLFHIYIYRLRRILRHAVLTSINQFLFVLCQFTSKVILPFSKHLTTVVIKITQPFNRQRPQSRTRPSDGRPSA